MQFFRLYKSVFSLSLCVGMCVFFLSSLSAFANSEGILRVNPYNANSYEKTEMYEGVKDATGKYFSDYVAYEEQEKSDLFLNPSGSLFDAPVVSGLPPSEEVSAGTALDKVFQTEYCEYEALENTVFDAKLITVRRKLKVENDEIFRVKVFMRNTGNVPWFSNESECKGYRVVLGTDSPMDRRSVFYSPNLEGIENTNWLGSNRVGMDQLRTDPGQIASFTFYSKASVENDVYREYFTPLIEGVEWINKARFSFDVIIGDIEETASLLRQKMNLAYESGSVLDIDLDAPRTIIVDISDQEMHIKLGDKHVKTFKVSTGKASTPTPIGISYISLKQEVRVAGKYPHYIMPKFMMFRAGGYGMHALPSLAFDGGYYWTEARSHIGIPVSHGCIRLLPEDADFLFDFTPIGTKVIVQP